MVYPQVRAVAVGDISDKKEYIFGWLNKKLGKSKFNS